MLLWVGSIHNFPTGRIQEWTSIWNEGESKNLCESYVVQDETESLLILKLTEEKEVK